jgi:hypothetical protein
MLPSAPQQRWMELAGGRAPPAGDSLEDAEVVAGQAVLAGIIKIRIKKLNGTKKNMRS